MAQAEVDVKHLLDECRTIEENCLYTAQAHYVIASQENWKKWTLLVVPVFLSGLAGALVATGLPTWIGIIGAALGGLGGVAAALGVDRESGNHSAAGKVMTALRHEARQIHEVFWKEMSRPELTADVRRLADRYNNLRLMLPTTSDKAFEKARKRIREGVFVPDFKTSTATPSAQGS